MTRDEILAEIHANNGTIHGPNVETVSMPLENYLRLRDNFASVAPALEEMVEFLTEEQGALCHLASFRYPMADELRGFQLMLEGKS